MKRTHLPFAQQGDQLRGDGADRHQGSHGSDEGGQRGDCRKLDCRVGMARCVGRSRVGVGVGDGDPVDGVRVVEQREAAVVPQDGSQKQPGDMSDLARVHDGVIRRFGGQGT